MDREAFVKGLERSYAVAKNAGVFDGLGIDESFSKEAILGFIVEMIRRIGPSQWMEWTKTEKNNDR
jgi:hypothetical protein